MSEEKKNDVVAVWNIGLKEKKFTYTEGNIFLNTILLTGNKLIKKIKPNET